MADVELIVTTIFDQITDALAGGGRVELRGSGAFAVKRRNARMGHNPRTGELVSVPEKPMLFFKTGRERGRLNRGGDCSPASPAARMSRACHGVRCYQRRDAAHAVAPVVHDGSHNQRR